MPTITLTITLEVPEGTTVDVQPHVTATPTPEPEPEVTRPEPVLTIMRSDKPEYPEYKDGGPRRPWTLEEFQYASDLDFTDEDVAAVIGRTPLAVHTFRRQQGIIPKARERYVAEAPRAMQRWTLSEIEAVKKHYAGPEDAEVLSVQLGRTAAAVNRMAGRLGLRTKP